MTASEILQWGPVVRFQTLPTFTQASVLFILILAFFFHIKFRPKTVHYAPTILTTTGIFFTFLGIAIGLANFNTHDVQASVPALLAGLKTAFWASVTGVGGALTIKVRHYVFGVREDKVEADDASQITIDDLARLLRGNQQALVGTDEATLISQIKLTRQDSNDRLDALKNAQMEALQKLSEMGSKTLIEALKSVIQDFNNNLTEQFGENFKHLNAGVEKLLLWQDQYKSFIDEITLRIVQLIKSMSEATANYSELIGKSEVLEPVPEICTGR